MKSATEKKVRDIRARAKDLKSCYIREIRNLTSKDADPEDKEVPRVSAIVIREGRWLAKVAKKFIDRHNLELSKEDDGTLTDAILFFDDLAETHSDDVLKNQFIYRVPAEFILHLEKLSVMVLKFDADVKAQIAKIELDDLQEDEELQQEIDAEMIG
jgi:hypothetical protein